MSLDRAIALAQAAVAADRKGDRSAAKDCFVEAASQLLAVVKAEPDRTKAAKLAQTVEEMPRRIRKILRFARRRVNKKARKLRERKTKTPRSLER